MEDIDRTWFDFTEIYVEKLHANESDWEALTLREQELAALWKLEADMNNGGFMQFFCNWGIDCYKIAIRALKNIKADKMLEIVEAEFLITGKIYKQYKTQIKEYHDIFKYITKEESAEFDRLDEAFWDYPVWDYPDSISKLGLKYYNA